MNYSIFLCAFILVFGSCTSSRNWVGTANATGTHATFEELNGKQDFTILVPDNNTYLKYHFAVSSGKLEAKIKSPTEVILSKAVGELDSDSIHIVNQKGAAYKIYLEGKKAAGDFNIRFSPGTN